MINIQSITIDFANLSENEQMSLWVELFEFAKNKLPFEKVMLISINKKSGNNE